VESKSSSASPVVSGLNVAAAQVVPNREVRGTPHVATSTNSDARARHPGQVSFPPGTKGSPSAAASQTVPRSTIGDRNEVSGVETNGRATPAAGVAEAMKSGDAVSSPGSTAASVATPHIHTASTDTSPDKEAPPALEAVREKSSTTTPDARPTPSVQPSRNSDQAAGSIIESAEEQLLRESRLSAQAATSRAPSSEPPKPAAAATSSAVAAPSPSLRADATTKPEVPDSQEDLHDKMDLDSTLMVNDKPSTIHAPQQRKSSDSIAPETSLLAQSPSKDTQVAERAVTRVSSGAMRLKSVTEIVGGTPRTANSDRAMTQDFENQLTPLTSTSHSPSSRYRHGRPQSRGQVSTVLFGKQPKRNEERSVAGDEKEILKPEDDYFTPLFVQGFTNSSSWMQPMEKLLFQANKTIATPDALLALQDHQACKVLRRVYHLQQNDKWSLRQPKRCPEPTRQTSQWDVLLKEVKWMRTDFREERKWKMALARNLAYACAEWHVASPEVRKQMQVPAHIPPKAQPTADVSMTDADEDAPENQPTPDLVSSADSPQNIEELSEDFVETVAPSAIFALQEDDLVFGLRRSPTADRLLDELPMYSSPLQVPKVDPLNPDFDPDALWRRPALPLSKYVEGQMKVVAPVPPRKRSRYEYEDDSSDDEAETLSRSDTRIHHMQLPPASDTVSLFKAEMKHTRDRLHAGHQFRPPSEHPMPIQSFYECRSPSQWTQSEDDELRTLVREFTYNWPLISGMLSSRSQFTSGAERRTPWECFERWINLEGLPADMSKTQYFKAYNSRIEAAQRVIMQQNQLAAQQASASGNNTTPLRRRPSTPLRVERRRNQKHLTLIDAMRKLAKKRETQQQKQQQTAAQSAANKKPIDSSSQRLPTKTPRDYSLLRWERDQALAERMAQYAAKQDVQRRVSAQIQAYIGYYPGIGLTIRRRPWRQPEIKVKLVKLAKLQRARRRPLKVAFQQPSRSIMRVPSTGSMEFSAITYPVKLRPWRQRQRQRNNRTDHGCHYRHP
jgi:chromatin modification-related protein VID21